MKYVAFLFKDKDIGQTSSNDGYNVVIPDVSGAYTCGDNFEHSIQMAKEVLELSIESIVEDEGKDIPTPSPLAYFSDKKKKELDIPLSSIPQLIEYKQPTSKRVNITIPATILQEIDIYAKQHQLNRSQFFRKSAKNLIEGS